MSRPSLRVGLIGSGFMGKAHAFGYGAAQKVFDLPFEVELHTLADATPELAEKAARELGFAKSTADWRAMVASPEIDVVNITAPNALHKEMALAAIAQRFSFKLQPGQTVTPKASFTLQPEHGILPLDERP